MFDHADANNACQYQYEVKYVGIVYDFFRQAHFFFFSHFYFNFTYIFLVWQTSFRLPVVKNIALNQVNGSKTC